jgi:hypothetical protein
MKKESILDVGVVVFAIITFGILGIIVAFTFTISNSYRVIAFICGLIFIIIGIYGIKGIRQLNSEK